MVVLDTNVVSELRKGPKATPSVWAWANSHAMTDFYLSTITIMEIEIGILRLVTRDARRAARYDAWLRDTVLIDFENRILPVDVAVARRCAGLHIPKQRPERDALIAATALVHGKAVATRNTRDFEDVGVRVVNPWQPAGPGLHEGPTGPFA
jgi:predicted nucleic acid-binding protein